MNEIVWPCDQMQPAYQVPIGTTAREEVPPFLKYGCSVHKPEPEVEVRSDIVPPIPAKPKVRNRKAIAR